jgi:hypothetical protein
MKSSVFWGITPFSPLNINSCLQEHVASIFKAEKYPKQEIFTCHLLHADFLLGLIFDPEDGGAIFLPNAG